MRRNIAVERRTYDADALGWRLRLLDACPILLTNTQVAAVLRCSARTVGRLVDNGLIPRRGRLLVIHREDVRAFLLARSEGARVIDLTALSA